MERVFSVEEIPDPFWAPPPPPVLPLQPQMIAGGVGGVGLGGGVGGRGGAMNRCPSEWYFQKFLEETLLDGLAPPPAANPNASVLYPNPMAEASGGRGYGDEVVEVIPVPVPAPAPAPAVVDPVEYNAMLKRKLDVDLAAVAMLRASGAMRPETSLGYRALPNSDGSNLGSQNYIGGNGILVQNKLGGGPSGGPGPYLVQKADARVKQATSSSSREPSPSDDDDDMEGQIDKMGNMNLTEEKVKKRKESNRESARRSRSRKAAHLKVLEEQVSQLRVENSSLLGRLADASHKYSDAAVHNRVLKADVETLKAKVKMAEETVKRVTGTNQLPQAISDMPSLRIPFSGSPSDATTDVSVPIQDNPITYFATATDAGINNSCMPEIDPTFQIEDMIDGALTTGGPISSMDQTASQGVTILGHLQRRVSGAPTSSGSAPWGSAVLDPNELVNMEML